jgi:hypothetical protein
LQSARFVAAVAARTTTPPPERLGFNYSRFDSPNHPPRLTNLHSQIKHPPRAKPAPNPHACDSRPEPTTEIGWKKESRPLNWLRAAFIGFFLGRKKFIFGYCSPIFEQNSDNVRNKQKRFRPMFTEIDEHGASEKKSGKLPLAIRRQMHYPAELQALLR